MGKEKIKILKIQSASYEQWEDFVEHSSNGTIFHLRRFLSYHRKGRYQDNSLVFKEKNKILALFPAAVIGDKLISHPGASYGGFVHRENLTLNKAIKIVKLLMEYARKNNFSGIEMTLPPLIYYKKPTDYISFSLFKNGFYLKKRELSGYIPLENQPFQIFKPEARTAARKAERGGVKILQSEDFDVFYSMLENNLGMRHNVKPTHTLRELKKLKKLFPERIILFSAYYKSKMIGGTVIFVANKNALLAFYISHNQEFQFLRPLNLLFMNVMEWGKKMGFRYLDLGTFTLNMEPNFGLARFKESIGATGIFRDTYALELDA